MNRAARDRDPRVRRFARRLREALRRDLRFRTGASGGQVDAGDQGEPMAPSTADFATRTEWDRVITEVTALSASPRNVRLKVGAATTAQLVWILAPRLPEPEGMAKADEQRTA